MVKKKKRDFISIADFSKDEIGSLLSLARRLKKKGCSKDLAGRTIGLIFQKPSTRTTVSFAVGAVQLGGHPLILNADVLQLKRGETPKDTGRVLSRYLDAIVLRANRHEDVVEMAHYATVPVINGLTDKEHPCQVMADLLTIMEKKALTSIRGFESIRVGYIGDGNNVAHSWALAAGLLGFEINFASPKGYEPSPALLTTARRLAKNRTAKIRVLQDPSEAARNADVLYTDVWASMGQEQEQTERKKDFSLYRIDSGLLKRARPKALVMHCLPAHREEEITEDVLEGPQSVVFDQAENRLHVQKAMLLALIKKSFLK